jgi:hypothetical protein
MCAGDNGGVDRSMNRWKRKGEVEEKEGSMNWHIFKLSTGCNIYTYFLRDHGRRERGYEGMSTACQNAHFDVEEINLHSGLFLHNGFLSGRARLGKVRNWFFWPSQVDPTCFFFLRAEVTKGAGPAQAAQQAEREAKL